MKLLSKKKRKIAVFFTGGLGDVLLHVPLLKELQKKQFKVTCIFYSKYNNDCLFDHSLYDTKLQLDTKLSLIVYALTRFKYFANVYINHLGGGKAVAIAANLCSKRVTQTNTIAAAGRTNKRNKQVILNFSDAEQTLHLLYSKQNAFIKNINNFYFLHPLLEPGLNKKFTGSNSSYFVVQVSAGNNTTPFKNWPAKYWLSLVSTFCNSYKNIDLIILGDHTETTYTTMFNELELSNCKVLIGKTSITELFNLVAQSSGYIGLDSGIMHMAVVLQKKTISIFGASNEKLYGYAILDEGNHKVVSSAVSCRPCSSWINANTTRVTNPIECPDFACLISIEPALVFQQVVEHFKL